MSQAATVSEKKTAEKAMIGVYDFSYAPYALGDALTWTMNLNVLAAEAGCGAIDQYLVMYPPQPSAPAQRYINQHNYVSVIDGLLPAFLCAPKLRSLKLIRYPRSFSLFLLRELVRGRPMWPSFFSQLNGKLDFTSHERINAHYRKHGTLPWLSAPRGYSAWADGFRRRHEGRFLVTVNVRQASLGTMPMDLHRDSPVAEWLAFFRRVGSEYPDVLFLLMGSYTEWERELLRIPNVMVLRALGLGLAHELALMHAADLFMGSSSGFAAMATFSTRPYFITNILRISAHYIDVPVGTSRYPFAGDHQILHWDREDRAILLRFFEQLYGRIRQQAGA